ncbi:kinase-like domain-containing protein [Lentinula edodes]|uniref:kinase-like domain-containing protein n=1 Tax=Lentinula edodes TaxID=5353 RepID=UPI001E8EA622|nr:kinase-like domain-containing protein [Lentinula edodes]KAH7880372.1 kinase-like domain-containing protein [Lentinula edodes]
MSSNQACTNYQYVVTSSGPKILPVDEASTKSEESPADYNAGGYLPIKLDDTFKHGRYRVIRKLGWGHFSTVWLVKDQELGRHSALKVVKSAGRYAETARDEIKLLSRVASFSPTHPGRQHIVSFIDSFSHATPEASHVCIVFEPLGENLLALIERNKKKGVPRALVKLIAHQVLLGLQYLHDECDLVHTDIKPENILISIPDIEAHIFNELSQCPSPTSRRVGVPLPTKSRSGVTVSLSQRGSRRQVQIFDSQPLSSPGRNSLSMSFGRFGSGGSTATSPNGSYISQNMPINSSIAGSAVPKMSTSAPKVPSGLSSSNLGIEPLTISKSTPNINPTQIAPIAPISLNSPSGTSSSSSSIASTSASTSNGAETCSNFSTPPTSLSHSLGNVLGNSLMLSWTAPHPKEDLGVGEKSLRPTESIAIPINGKKGKGKAVTTIDPSDTTSLSWKDKLAISGASWKDRISAFSSSSSHKSSLSSSNSQVSRPTQGHSRSHSGLPGSWKDPGLAAPAPAVVVSAVITADGEKDGDFFQIAGASSSLSGSSISSSSTVSQSSSATTTLARPSPSGTARPSPEPTPITSQIKPLPDITISTQPRVEHKLQNPNHPSLLSQTAPPRDNATSFDIQETERFRSSPQLHGSQISAHMNQLPPPDYPSTASFQPPTLVSVAEPTKPKNKSTHSQRKSSSHKVAPIEIKVQQSPPTPPPSPNPSFVSPSVHSPLTDVNINQSATQPVDVPYHPLPPPPPPTFSPPVSIKIADLGNATPSKKHYTEDIQTRQYRAPEAIIGRKDWDARADIWSVACVVFELLTGEYLFDPQAQGGLFTKDDDHMAQIIELIGDFPLTCKMGGKYSRDLFDHTGSLRYIKSLKPWPLKRVMTEKYSYSDSDSEALCGFLLPMLATDMKKRVHARDIIDHEWLTVTEADDTTGEW